MKKLLSYILISSFLFQSTSQFWIVTSFVLQQDFIANNLCVNRYQELQTCNGKCFLIQEFQEEENRQEQQFPDPGKKEIQLFANDFSFLSINVQDYLLGTKKIFYWKRTLAHDYHYTIFHPPRQYKINIV